MSGSLPGGKGHPGRGNDRLNHEGGTFHLVLGAGGGSECQAGQERLAHAKQNFCHWQSPRLDFAMLQDRDSVLVIFPDPVSIIVTMIIVNRH